MSHVRLDDWVKQDSASRTLGNLGSNSPAAMEKETAVPGRRIPAAATGGPRRTPRLSLILVLAEDQAIEPERLAVRLAPRSHGDVDVTIVACAGEPSNLDELKRTARDAQFLLAPAGTSAEDLRELAMEQTPGDIVTLLNAAHLSAGLERDHVLTS